MTIRTWGHGTHQRQGRLTGNASVTSSSATSFGARWETTYADGKERTSALPPTASGPYSPVKHKCLHKAYNDLLSQNDQHLEIRLLNDTIGGLRRLFQSSLLENDQDWVAGTGGRYCPGKAPMLRKLRDFLEQELPLYVPGRYNDQCVLSLVDEVRDMEPREMLYMLLPLLSPLRIRAFQEWHASFREQRALRRLLEAAY